MSNYLGIEIGGTKLQVGVGPDDGTLRALWRGNVDIAAGPEGIRRQIAAAVPEVLTRAGLDRGAPRGVGIGFGGPVDDATRTVIKSHQIEDWDGFPLADWVSEMVGLPAVLGNDSDVAGLAEALHGAGKGLSPIFYINIGSGIGGGLIIEGEIYRGVGRGAAEVGHLLIGEMVGSHPLHLPMEGIASGWSIQEHALRAIQYEPKSRLAEHFARSGTITAIQVAQAAKENDDLSIRILDRATDAIAAGLSHVITLLCPRRIILGGGVAQLGEELLFAPIRHRVSQWAFAPFAGLTDIVPAALGEEVVVHGAIALARKQIR